MEHYTCTINRELQRMLKSFSKWYHTNLLCRLLFTGLASSPLHEKTEDGGTSQRVRLNGTRKV